MFLAGFVSNRTDIFPDGHMKIEGVKGEHFCVLKRNEEEPPFA